MIPGWGKALRSDARLRGGLLPSALAGDGRPLYAPYRPSAVKCPVTSRRSPRTIARMCIRVDSRSAS